MKSLEQMRKEDPSRFVERQLDGADITSIEQVTRFLRKLPGVYSPFFPEKWANRPKGLLTEEEAAKLESGKRILETLVEEAAYIGFTRIQPHFSRNEENDNRGDSYGVHFHLCGYHMDMKMVPIAYGLLSDISK